jgi:hypothetical protein
MGHLLHFALVMVAVLCVLVWFVMWASNQQSVFTSTLYVTYADPDHPYRLTLVDTSHHMQFDLTGTKCDPGPPSWIIGGYHYNDPTLIYDNNGLYIIRDPISGERCKLGEE